LLSDGVFSVVPAEGLSSEIRGFPTKKYPSKNLKNSRTVTP
jgi:hypothetical protein